MLIDIANYDPNYSIQQFICEYGNPGVIVAQHGYEFKALLDLYIALKPKNVLEIGRYHCGSLYYWLKYASSNCESVVSIGFGDDSDPAEICARCNWGLDLSKLHTIIGDSSSVSVFEQVKSISPSYDFVFIDGWHFLPTVKSDVEWYGSLVDKGVVAMHDICDVDVVYVWEEIKHQFKHQELLPADLYNRFQYQGGLGILYKGI